MDPAIEASAAGNRAAPGQRSRQRAEPLSGHVSRERTPGDRGRGLGAALPERVARTIAIYERMFTLDMELTRAEVRALGRRVGEALARLRPQGLEEICGIAHGAGQPEELLLAVNARVEILAGGTVMGVPRPPRRTSECTAVGAARDRQAGGLLAQNWDFHPDVAATRLLWIVAPPGRRGWVTLTEAGLLAKTGMNADGLALTVNFLADVRDGGVDGVPAHVLMRWLLEDCATVDEVEATIAATPRNASMCLTVAARRPGARGRVAAFELVPDGCAVLPLDDRGRVAHTNHFLTPISSLRSAAGADMVENSVTRLERTWRTLERDKSVLGLDAVVAALSDQRDPRHPVFRRPEGEDVPWLERCETLATVVYEVGDGAMWLRAERTPQAPFERVALPWD
jgi:isopenicillin-N N-acyltransferase-like protein